MIGIALHDDVAGAHAVAPLAAYVGDLLVARRIGAEQRGRIEIEPGIDAVRRYEPGDLVQPGAIVRLVDPDNLELVVYVSAAVLAKVRLGQRIPLSPDGDENTYEGEIVFIANQGEFTPRNLQTEEARARQMFGIKLRVSSYNGALKAGMTLTAQIPLEQAEAS